jgi:DNA-directed RNA polymerase sigma subunit (sigma70/sigma32)
MNKKLTKNQQKVISILCELSDREIIILKKRFCFSESQEKTAKLLRLTKERVRQIEDNILKKIK